MLDAALLRFRLGERPALRLLALSRECLRDGDEELEADEEDPDKDEEAEVVSAADISLSSSSFAASFDSLFNP